MKTKTKSTTLRAFRVVNQGITEKNSNLLSMLREVLSTKKTVDSRRMLLNKEDDDEDILSNFELTNGYAFGTMLRIIPSENGGIISPELFKKEKVTLTELEVDKERKGSQYKDHYYFLLTDEYVITNLSGTYSVERLQTYINWLLQEVRGETLFVFHVLVKHPQEMSLSDIREFEFGGGMSMQNSPNLPKEEMQAKNTVLDVAVDVLKGMFQSAPKYEDIDLTQIVSAKLCLLIKSRPKEMAEEEYQRIMGAMLTPFPDGNYLKIKTKRNGILSGTDIKVTSKEDVECTQKGRFVEEHLKQKMEAFLIHIKDKLYEVLNT